MTNFERNIRTLIICFVVAIFALVPLRFLELGQQGAFNYSAPTVLGASTESEVVLPNANVDINKAEDSRIEAPYNREVVTTTETTKAQCMSAKEVDAKVKSIIQVMNYKQLDPQTEASLIRQIEDISMKKCR
jgi:hypothetical protein